MPTRISIVPDDDVKSELYRLVESGRRNRIINAALRRELLSLRRHQASRRLDRLRSTTLVVSSAELVKLVRRYRAGRG
jgi:hypothetical protein